MMHRWLSAGKSCQDIADDASSFVDGELSGAAWIRFRAHLLMCGPCAAYIRQFGLTIDLLRALPGPNAQADRQALADLFTTWHAAQRHTVDASQATGASRE